MMRFANSLILAAITAICGGCVAPALVKSVDPGDFALLNPADHSVVVKHAEAIATSPDAVPIEPARVALQQVPHQPSPEAAGELWTLQRIKPISDISLDIAAPPLVSDQQRAIAPPHDYAAEALPVLAQEQPFTRGDLVDAGYEWQPSPEGLTFCHQPLYFEEVNLERYGRSFGVLQPLVSAAKFYGRIPALPYMVLAQPARRCTYHAHWSLPGYKIPVREHQPFVPSLHGGAAEVVVLYGIILLIP